MKIFVAICAFTLTKFDKLMIFWNLIGNSFWNYNDKNGQNTKFGSTWRLSTNDRTAVFVIFITGFIWQILVE